LTKPRHHFYLKKAGKKSKPKPKKNHKLAGTVAKLREDFPQATIITPDTTSTPQEQGIEHYQKRPEPDLTLKDLGQYYGSQEWQRDRLTGVLLTDGVRYIMENGYSWFVSDALPVLKENEAKGEAFQVVGLKLGPRKEADLTIGDGNDHQLYKKHIGYTDAKAKPKLYFTDNVLMLSGEY
jgi:hypothetical protein